MAGHSRWSRAGASQNAVLVVECDGPIAADRVSAALDRFLDLCPWPAGRLRRPFPWGRLHWTAGPREGLTRPPVRRADLATREDLERAVIAELNRAIEPRREAPVRILLLDGPTAAGGARAALVLTWFHPLMDARGGENLLSHLDQLDRHPDTAIGAERPAFVPDRDRRRLSERGRIARGSLGYMRRLAPVPPVSPGRALTSPGGARFRVESFSEPERGEHDRRATREISWRLAVVGKAMTALWQRRGLPDVPFLLPISVDLRRKGDAGPTFGNVLAFHFARFRPSDTADLPGLARALRLQMASAVRDGQIEANAAGMEFLGYVPLSMMLRVLPWTSSGELFSFNCADLQDWPPALAECFGQRVVNAYHVPVVPGRPGIGVFFNRCGSRNNVVVSWSEGAADDEDAARITRMIRDGMQWSS